MVLKQETDPRQGPPNGCYRRCRRDDLHPLPDQAGRRAGAAHCPAGEADSRFPVRPLRHLQLSRLHHRPGTGELLELEADHRRHAEIENAIRDLKYGVGLNHLPSGRLAANGAWRAVQVMAHNLARWTARIGLGEQIVTTRRSDDGSSPWSGGSPAPHAG